MELHLSRAAVVALAAAALVASATTGAAAGRLLTGADIKNHSIERHDLADDSVGNRVLRDSTVGWAKLRPGLQERLDASGVPGPAGSAGPAGPAGAPGLSGYQLVVETVVGPSGTVAVVDCPAGTSVLGGGSGPADLGGVGWEAPKADGTGWRGEIQLAGPGDVTVEMYAICASVR